MPEHQSNFPEDFVKHNLLSIALLITALTGTRICRNTGRQSLEWQLRRLCRRDSRQDVPRAEQERHREPAWLGFCSAHRRRASREPPSISRMTTRCSTTSSGPQSEAIRRMGTTWAPGPRATSAPLSLIMLEWCRLLCNVHSEMSGFIVVSPTPYFAQTDSAGNFKIDNIPDGKYTVVAWHEGSKPQSKISRCSGDGQGGLHARKVSHG